MGFGNPIFLNFQQSELFQAVSMDPVAIRKSGKHLAERPTLGRGSDPAVNAYAQYRVRRWLAEHGDGKTLAESAGVAESFVSTLKEHGSGVGWRSARGLAKAMGMTLAEFIEEADAWWASREQPMSGGPQDQMELSKRTGWATARAELAKKYPVTRAELDALGKWRQHPVPEPLTAKYLWQCIQLLRQSGAP